MASTPTNLFFNTVKVEKRQLSKDEGYGNVTTTWLSSFLKCKIMYTDDGSSDRPYGIGSAYGVYLYCSPNENVNEGDRITIKNKDLYKVSSVIDGCEMNIYKRIQLERVS